MELEGFGASLLGRAIYVYAEGKDIWLPWEFISGNYTCKILVTTDLAKYHCLEFEHNWTIIFRPQNAKDWSCIATIIRGMGGSVLLTFDSGCSRPPDSFLSFIGSVVSDARTVLTRVWVGRDIEIPVVPDAVFFPVGIREYNRAVYELIGRLPARQDHGPLRQMTGAEWTAMIDATIQSGIGLMVSDIGEREWKLFWHKLSDSVVLPRGLEHGLSWLRTATEMIEKGELQS
jgi:hypothetical protein